MSCKSVVAIAVCLWGCGIGGLAPDALADSKRADADFYEFIAPALSGDAEFLYSLGQMYLRGDTVERDLVQAAEHFQNAWKAGHQDSVLSLRHLQWQSPIREHFAEEVTQEWGRAARNIAKQQGATDAKLAKAYFDRGDLADFTNSLDDAQRRWKAKSAETIYHYHAGVWWEAQTQSGRFNQRWKCELFSWVITKYEESPMCGINCIGARHNLTVGLKLIGLNAQRRQVCDEMKEHILKIDGIDVDRIRAVASMAENYRYELLTFPVRIDFEQATDSKRGRPPEDLMCANSIGALRAIGSERLSVGDWESALFYSGWIEALLTHIEVSGEAPRYIYPGYIPSNDEGMYFLRAEVFTELGLFQHAEPAYRTIIDKQYKSYGGSGYHAARYLLADLLVQVGRASEVDLDELLEIEASMAANKFEGSENWRKAKLVRAKVLAAVGEREAGIRIAAEVLDFTEGADLPPLRLSALLTNVELRLGAERLQGVQTMLVEALDSSRSLGLLFEELEVYKLHVQYSLQSQQYHLALEMQQRVLGLINTLNLDPLRAEAAVTQARIYELLGDDRATLAALQRSQDGHAYVEWMETLRKRICDLPIVDEYDEPIFDLQPMRIVSAPINRECQGVFMLSNPSGQDLDVELQISGDRAAQLQQRYNDAVYIELQPDSGTHESSLTVSCRLGASMQLPVYLTMMDALEADDTIEVRLTASAKGQQQVSEWSVELDRSDAMVSVVDAAHLVDSPFYLLSVFHHVATADGQHRDLAIRAVASRPTRIEAYNSDGELIFIDANGNGSLADSGDMVATELIYELNPVLSLGGQNQQIEFMYQPIDNESRSRIEIEIQTNDLSAVGEWEVNAIDWLEVSGE